MQCSVQIKEYYEQATKFGNSNVMFSLGLLYANGQGVKQDYIKAKEYYEQAIDFYRYYTVF